MTENRKKWISAAAVAAFMLFMGLAGWYVGVPMVRLAEDPEAFRLWVDSYGLWGRIAFVAMVVIQVVVALIPGEPIELAAGYAFGVLEGSLLTLGGFLIGSWLVFALVRRFGVQLVEVFFSGKQIREMSFLKNPKKTRVIAMILMVIPGTPKDFLSYFAGLTKLTLREWLTIVAIGRIPSLLTSCVTGAAAGDRNYILSAASLAVTCLISAAGVVYYRRICKAEREAEENAKE